MQTGAITPYIDVAQLVLYAFWIFFAALIWYLVKENKREGYPLVTNRPGERPTGLVPLPAAKTYLLPNGKTKSVPWNEPLEVLNARPSSPLEGAPIIPLGNPMQDGLGPAAYTQRSNEPETLPDGEHRIVPMRVAHSYSVASEDPDPRGAPVITLDGKIAGTVIDLWVDLADQQLVWYEAEAATTPPRRVMFPAALACVQGSGRAVKIKVVSVTAGQFAEAPSLQNPNQITPREEDRLMAYFASGHLYATPARSEPYL